VWLKVVALQPTGVVNRFANGLAIISRHVVIGTGNPRVFFAIPGPVPVNYPYPPCGYGFSRGSTKINPGVTLYPYPWRVTRGFATI
jgi:hypothetical protein